ncbi:MAG TPA: hypothetical protein VEC56_04495 [Candidatus Krumholzibacteria bacterium]|nr:hypothetical protein [Candidatus Krumholzibacteria bacterium]
MKRLFYPLAIAGLAMTLAFLPACDDDDDNPMGGGPTTGTVAGTVTFEGTWPSVGNVQISVYSTYPPMGPPDAFTDPIPAGTSYDYSIAGLDPGDYAAILVGWRDPADPPGAKVIGMYWAFVDSVAVDGNGDPVGPPSAVTVEAGQTESNLDITANLDVAP